MLQYKIRGLKSESELVDIGLSSGEKIEGMLVVDADEQAVTLKHRGAPELGETYVAIEHIVWAKKQ